MNDDYIDRYVDAIHNPPKKILDAMKEEDINKMYEDFYADVIERYSSQPLNDPRFNSKPTE